MIWGASTHPYMLENAFRNVYSVNELVQLRDELRDYEKSSPEPIWKQMGPYDSRLEILRGRDSQTPTTPDTTTSPDPDKTSLLDHFGISTVGISLNFVKHLECLIAAKESKKLKCVGIDKRKCKKPGIGSYWRGRVRLSSHCYGILIYLPSLILVRARHLQRMQV